jgi:hypothetical protein
LGKAEIEAACATERHFRHVEEKFRSVGIG